MDTPYHRREVRHKSQSDLLTQHARQALFDFRQMAMPRHPVGFEIIRGFRKQIGHFRLAPCTGHTRFGIGNQVVCIDRACFQ